MGRKKNSGRRGSEPTIREETRHAILAVVSFAVAAFLVLAWLGYAGAAGRLLYSALETVFGVGFFVFPLLALLLGFSFLQSTRPNLVGMRFLGGGLFLVATLALAAVGFGGEEGGWLGRLIAWPIVKLFDYYAGVIILVAILAISIVIMFETKLSLDWSLFGWGKRRNDEEGETSDGESMAAARAEEEEAGDGGEAPPPAKTEKIEKAPRLTAAPVAPAAAEDEWQALGRKLAQSGGGKFTPPPLALLERDSGKPGVGDIKANANIIKRTLANFGIVVEMDEVAIGPSITRYAFKPAEGVKLSRIVGLQNDLALALAAHPIRIEAPIPGRSLVGIEIPNQTKSRVGLASLLATPDFTESPHPLFISLGRGISGQPHFSNLAKAPHLLVAGATGSGKSVVIHTFIASLLFRNPPENLRFLMIDPKRVELTVYNRIPHLLAPVITNAKKAILHLKWAIGEMERRYALLEQSAVRDIQSYHQNILQPALKRDLKEGEVLPDRLPYLIIIIDELADIMSAYPRELEAAIVRLAQMSRAVGIHLVLSTQRPSVEVITGLIKANIPSRIALQVASQIDSRTIIDMAGAEKLLGAGDLLYLSGEMAKPLRLQSAFISESEVKKLVDYLADHYHGSVDPAESLELEGARPNLEAELETLEAAGDDDELYAEAKTVVVESGKASASLLQRRLKVGYARAARLLDMLEERGVVGPGEGAKPREVYGRRSGQDETDNDHV